MAADVIMAEIIKLPDVIEESAEHLFLITERAKPGRQDKASVAPGGDKDWFLHITMASEAAQADLASGRESEHGVRALNFLKEDIELIPQVWAGQTEIKS